MKSSSPEPIVLPAPAAEELAPAGLDAELRTGSWTRLGGFGVLGDRVTEATLARLAERAERAARAQGYARGWAEGRRAAEEAAASRDAAAAREREAARAGLEAEWAARLQALHAAARGLHGRLEEASAAFDAHVVEVALALTEAVLGRELAVAAEPGADALRRVLSVLPADAAAFRVRMHPDDAAGLPEDLAGAAVVVPDGAIARGDAVAESDTAVVDASVAAALRRVREVLEA